MSAERLLFGHSWFYFSSLMHSGRIAAMSVLCLATASMASLPASLHFLSVSNPSAVIVCATTPPALYSVRTSIHVTTFPSLGFWFDLLLLFGFPVGEGGGAVTPPLYPAIAWFLLRRHSAFAFCHSVIVVLCNFLPRNEAVRRRGRLAQIRKLLSQIASIKPRRLRLLLTAAGYRVRC